MTKFVAPPAPAWLISSVATSVPPAVTRTALN